MFKLDPITQTKYNKAREFGLNQKQTFASMDDASLVASAKFWMAHCSAPKQIAPEEPIYDSTFWHAIAPELIRRLEKHGQETGNGGR